MSADPRCDSEVLSGVGTSLSLFDRIAAFARLNCRVALLASGAGSNANAILSHREMYRNMDFVCLITNRPEAPARSLAAHYGIRDICLPFNLTCATREAWFLLLADVLMADRIDFLIYAGFMLVAPAWFVTRFPGINIHPADLTILAPDGLPRFRGMSAVRDVIASGAPTCASSVHIVARQVDCGLVLAVSRQIPIVESSNEAQLLHARLKTTCEHTLYPKSLQMLSQSQLVKQQLPYREPSAPE